MAPLTHALFLCSALIMLSTAQVTPPPRVPALPVPTQFEVAMTQTLQAVREGSAPDPALRKPDGTPGTLLEALLPEDLTDEDRKHRRRQLAAKASSWRFFGANIPLSAGPTLSAINASLFRYSSVTPAPSVDWRNTIYVTPILAQYDCASCWAMAAADTVAMATAIAAGTPAIAPGVQQLCDCGGMECCQGGWPEDAFSWMVANGNITTAANYNYWAQDNRTCAIKPNYPTAGNITGWERVPVQNIDALKKAVNMQPVLIYISASSNDFQAYNSTGPGGSNFNIYDGNCTSEVNHAMVVVGYGTWQLQNYWILKNTWPDFGWGHNGYMYLKMQDGSGKCGMQTVSPVFPTYYPNAPIQATVKLGNTFPVMASKQFWWQSWQPKAASPCDKVINPCGAGYCYYNTTTLIARCMCPSNYVELVGVPTSKCVEASPCTSGLFNPCGLGVCSDVGDGSYFCTCTAGYVIGTLVSGSPTCVPYFANSSSQAYNTYVTQYGDNCTKIQQVYGISSSNFYSLNPNADCSGLLAPGIVFRLPFSSTRLCTQQYAAAPTDKCNNIAYSMDSGSTTSLTTAYPCTTTASLSSTTTDASTPSTLSTPSTDSASASTNSLPSQAMDMATGFVGGGGAVNSYSWSPSSLVLANPTLDCTRLMFASQLVCVNKAVDMSVVPVTCGQTYATAKGDTCGSVQLQYNLTASLFAQLNPGLNCNFNAGGYLSEGLQLCVSAKPAVNVTCTQWYTVQQGDTCAHIWNAANLSQYQMQYINPGLQCQPPFLYVGLQLCIDSPLLANISDPNYLLYTIQVNDNWGNIQAQFTSKCKAFSVAIPKIAQQNNIPVWSNYKLTPGATLIIPCVPKVGVICGCSPSLTVCGADLQNYASYCDARCNFATPVTSGACSSCANDCAGRYGLTISSNACGNNYVCPWPAWPPPSSDASAVFTTKPLCSYRDQTCTNACNFYVATTQGGVYSDCYNGCMACSRVPCSGPPELVAMNGVLASGTQCLNSCTTTGCKYYSKSSCSSDCNYWNSWWNPINP